MNNSLSSTGATGDRTAAQAATHVPHAYIPLSRTEMEADRLPVGVSSVNVANDDLYDSPNADSPCFDWFAASPLLPRVLLTLNTVLLVILVLVMIVVYVRVQSALDSVDALTSDFSKFPK
jgi:hypothetical protein